MGYILSAGEEPHERPPQLGLVVPNRAAQHWIVCLECIEHRLQRSRAINVELNLFVDARQRAQMDREDDSYHFKKGEFTEGNEGNKGETKCEFRFLRSLHFLLCNSTAQGRVCASTDRTAGRSRTIGFHVSPALVDA
jgi:hypothetical protein